MTGGELEGPPERLAAPARPRAIVAFGTLALDSVETRAGSAHDLPGGSALYFALAASLLAPVHVVGVVGDDYPPSCLAGLQRRGVDVSGVRRAPGRTMRWRARYSDDLRARLTLSSDRGVASTSRPIVPAPATRAPVAFLGSTDPRHQTDVLDHLDGPDLVALDTMVHWIQERPTELCDLVGRADVLFVNETEARALGRDEHLSASVASIRRMGPAWVVVKLGRAGARAYGPEGTISVPAADVTDVQDPTGSGDAFAGGVVGYLGGTAALDTVAFRTALRFGAAAASFAIEGFGTGGLEDASTERLLERAGRVRVLPRSRRSP